MNRLWWNTLFGSRDRPNEQAFHFVLCSAHSPLACSWIVACWQQSTSQSDSSRVWVFGELMSNRFPPVDLRCHVAGDGWHSHAQHMTPSPGHSWLAQGYRQCLAGSCNSTPSSTQGGISECKWVTGAFIIGMHWICSNWSKSHQSFQNLNSL